MLELTDIIKQRIWWLIIGWIPGLCSLWMVYPFILAPNFVSVTPSMGILLPILRRNEVSTRWSSFLIFLCFANCILGILKRVLTTGQEEHNKIQKKEDQSVDTSYLLRIGSKIPMEGVTESKFGAETKG